MPDFVYFSCCVLFYFHYYKFNIFTSYVQVYRNSKMIVPSINGWAFMYQNPQTFCNIVRIILKYLLLIGSVGQDSILYSWKLLSVHFVLLQQNYKNMRCYQHFVFWLELHSAFTYCSIIFRFTYAYICIYWITFNF